jgi:transcriptional regulator with XRE-family HTH domain
VSRRFDPDTVAIVAAFARRLGAARAAAGLTHEALAERAGLHRNETSKLERALTDPRLSTVVRVARGLDVPTSALVEDEDRQLSIELAPGERRLTPEEFEEHFGRLPTDGEG